MEWLALVNWLLVVMLALPLSSGVITGNVWLGLQVMAALGGLALTIVYLSVGWGIGLIWASGASAAIGVIALTAAAGVLMSPGASSAGQTADESHALLAGALLPFFATAGLLALLIGLGVGHVAVT